MKGNQNDLRGSFLFALNIFIVFLLLFESKLVIPLWLQPVGRMHPLVLHFPIVLLLLSLLMEFFRYKTEFSANEFYQRFTADLLLAGVVTAGVTVIMGLFLSQEEGYNDAALQWHKWSGVSVFFFASAIYTVRKSRWYKDSLAKAGAVITTLCLISAGHFGGALTHGDNFIWQPVMVRTDAIVPVGEAVVFGHVIRPVFESKCMSCHNPDKLKGKLMLTDSAAILKGGKSGELFVPGRPELSLMMRRLQLPLEDKKHMPPSGKPQLTDNERTLLHHWIVSGTPFNVKVMDLPETDSLRIAAMRILLPAEGQEVFPFPAVAHETLEKLNSNYRVVSPLAKNSPALTVNIYNRETYTPRTLEELKEVKTQLISLDLGKMPVKDEDLQYIVRFENLRRLNLNFSDITGEGLQTLSSLEHLNSLSVAGTNVNYRQLRQYLPLFEKLETLAVWNTGLSADEVRLLQSEFRNVKIFGGAVDGSQPLIKLNPPRLRNKSAVFDDSIVLALSHPVKGAEIRYTIDGSEPDSLTSGLFKGQIVLRKSTQIKARAFKEGWLTSDVAVLSVYGSRYKPDTVILLSRLNRVHPANGAQTFFDRALGTFNANSPAWANNWAGFVRNDMALLARFDTPTPISSVSLNTLNETENVIFPPEAIEIWGGDSEDDLVLLHRASPAVPAESRKPYISLIDCEFRTKHVRCLKIVARPLTKIPVWHKNKNRPALLLVDEILLN